MRIGLITQLHGRPDGDTAAPSWQSISERAATAEAAGFDMFVFEDALLYRGKETQHVRPEPEQARPCGHLEIAHRCLIDDGGLPDLVEGGKGGN